MRCCLSHVVTDPVWLEGLEPIRGVQVGSAHDDRNWVARVCQLQEEVRQAQRRRDNTTQRNNSVTRPAQVLDVGTSGRCCTLDRPLWALRGLPCRQAYPVTSQKQQQPRKLWWHPHAAHQQRTWGVLYSISTSWSWKAPSETQSKSWSYFVCEDVLAGSGSIISCTSPNGSSSHDSLALSMIMCSAISSPAVTAEHRAGVQRVADSRRRGARPLLSVLDAWQPAGHVSPATARIEHKARLAPT